MPSHLSQTKTMFPEEDESVTTAHIQYMRE